MANEGLEAQRKEEDIEKRKRKKENDAAWEGRRPKFQSSSDEEFVC